jgi:hypothetical protein
MLIHRGYKTRFFRTAAVGLLAGCSWFSTTSVALAQNQSQSSDVAIQSSVMAAIGQDSTLKGQNISATAAQGVVTLTGTVQTDAQSQQAESDAANVSGVSGILNHLNVTNPSAAAPAAGLSAQASADQLSPQDQNSVPPPPDQNQSQNQGSVPPPPPDVSQPQPPPPPAYGGPRPAYQPGYVPQQSYSAQSVPYYATPAAPVTIPAGTLLRVRLSEPLDTKTLKSGTIFQATSAIDVYQNGVLAIPRGAVLTGQVVESKNAGDLGGSAVLRLDLTNVNLDGKIFPINSDVWSSKGPNKAGYTAGNTAGGALFGALIGGIIGRGAGAAVGAGVGAVGGLAVSGATSGPRIYLPVETQVDFHLTNPVTVQPVPWQEAQRLASTVPQPVLVQRPRPVYVVPGPYYGPYPYGYPYPY